MIDLIQEAANQYYILEIGLLYLLDREDVVQSLGSETKNNNETKFVMKTKDGLIDVEELSEYTALTREQVLDEIRKPEWT